MTNKFKVGDKVRFIEDFGTFTKGAVVKIVSFIDKNHIEIEGVNKFGDFDEGDCYLHRVELVDLKPTKNQRITALEETVAKQGEEIEELKLIVAQIRKPSTVVEEALANDIIEFEGKQYKKVDREAREGDVVIFNDVADSRAFRIKKPYKVLEGLSVNGGSGYGHFSVYTNVYNRTKETVDVYELIVEDKQDTEPPAPKTQNELRAEIIEKAKGFVDNILGKYDTFNTTIGKYKDQCVRPVFQVNEKKRAITVLIYGAFSKVLVFKGITKCHPKSVFNVWIGKAIALGRALGLDVSEFEQAVQPTLAIGQIVKFGNEEARLIPNSETAYHDNGTARVDSYFSINGTIINDTNAQYGGAE